MSHDSFPVAATGCITAVTQLQTAVYSITVQMPKKVLSSPLPQSGQFFMLRRIPSNVFLSRPISIYRVFSETNDALCIEFLILEKGTGTQELVSAKAGTEVSVIGPLGNTFPVPKQDELHQKRITIVGGGIGIAPVASFASTLIPGSYNFYACFKSGSYGLECIKPAKLAISTDDGSCGTKGMLPNIFTETEAAACSVVYACGPEPMLKYVQKICMEAHVPSFLSLESRMACGVGACLGCTVTTTEGNKRCCKDGPVFLGESIIWSSKK